MTLADRDIVAVDRVFLPLTIASLLVPTLIGGLVSGTWWGALTPRHEDEPRRAQRVTPDRPVRLRRASHPNE